MKRFMGIMVVIAAALGMAVGSSTQPTQAAGGASFYASPTATTYQVGDVIRVAIMINSAGQAINAGEATITWTPGLQYSFVSTASSIFTTWTSGGGAGPVGSVSSVYFSGGLSNPGYNGSAGRVVTVIFNATQPGTYSVHVAGSQILANDGMGTNILCCSSGTTFTVAAKAPPQPLLSVVSKTHPNQNQWYKAHDVNVNWYATTAIGNYSFKFDHSPTGNPTTPNNATIQTTKTLEDGLWYFHLKGSNTSGSATVHFAIRIDSKPPGNFAVIPDNGGNSSNPTPKMNFNSVDATSGVERYTASIDGGPAFPMASGDAVPRQKPGEHTIVVTAHDRAGNTTEASLSFKVEGITPPTIVSGPTSLVIQKPMKFIGQSSATDTIFVYLNGKLVDQFIAKTKQVAKSKSKGGGGFPEGITWEYRYNAELFPGSYKVFFSRTTSVGAESEPTKVRTVTITATAAQQSFGKSINLSIAVLQWLLIIILLILNIIFYSLWRYYTYLLKKGGNDAPLHDPLHEALREVAAWRPFGWLVNGTLKAQRGFMRLGPLRRRKQEESAGK
ncbi:MAG TPA: hypothetical protein VF272_04525 [Candidatus Saccharimonadia bacterium]